MPNKGLASTTLVDTSAELLFAFFVYIADAENSMSAREVQCLHLMIEEPNWCDDADIQKGIENLRARYLDLWKDFQKKSFAHDLKSISERIQTVGILAEDPVRALASLRTFVNRFSQNSSPMLVRIGLGAMPTAKQRAQQDLLNVLSSPEGVHKASNLGTPRDESLVQSNPTHVPETAAHPDADLSIWPSASLKIAAENIWKRGKTPVRCMAVIPETHDVKTFVFQAVQPVLFAYKPGQFATLELPIEGKVVRRSYTISSSPSRPHAISITVKRVPGGLVSNWLHDNMQVGFQFSLSGPHGEFTCFDAPADKLLLIAAGSGVTPIMSMLRWLVDTSSTADIVFINNIRTPADVIFDSELKYLGMRLGNKLKVGVVPGSVDAGQAWNGPVCHFTEHLIRMWAPDFAEREVFVCGPPGYMGAVRNTLMQIGFPERRYHQESFGGPAPAQTAAPAPDKMAPAAPVKVAPVTPVTPVMPAPVTVPKPPVAVATEEDKVELVFSVSSKTVMATANDFILDVAEEHGIALANSCRAGNCGTCKIKKNEGTVEMDAQQALSEADIEEGFVLACVGRACSRRVVLEA